MADIQAAADTLHPIYERAQGHDGFVSLEVAPDLANDTTATIAEARRLHSMVGKPNVMIKVPATRAGIPAIERLIADGININVTLIFSLERYAAVKEAFIKGLESRRAQQLPIDRIASVASFFISRVDVNIDQRLADRDDGQELMGAIAIANAKLAYAQFQRVFDGARWQSLVAEGARVQRPLWASTSTKNPDYPDLLYVDTLIGPHTVNTVPPKTLEAIQDHGTIARTIDRDLDSAQRQMVALAALGIDIDEVTQELEVEGVQKFADSYDALLEAIEEQRKVLAAGQAS